MILQLLLILLIGSAQICMGMSPAVTAQIAAYNEWKKAPGKTAPIFLLEQSDGTDEHSVAMYVLGTILADSAGTLYKQKVQDAVHFAQAVCPSFPYWPEFFATVAHPKRKDGSAYSDQKTIKIFLKPLIKKINQYRMVVAILSDQKIPKEELLDVVAEERKFRAALKPGEFPDLRALISKLVPERKAELQRLQAEYSKLANPETMCEIIHASIRITEKKELKYTMLKHDAKHLQAEHEKLLKSHERLIALVALHKSSQGTNGQSDFVRAIQSELDKVE